MRGEGRKKSPDLALTVAGLPHRHDECPQDDDSRYATRGLARVGLVHSSPHCGLRAAGERTIALDARPFRPT